MYDVGPREACCARQDRRQRDRWGVPAGRVAGVSGCLAPQRLDRGWTVAVRSIAHPSVAERRGKAGARIAIPPVNHAGTSAADRPEPVTMLEEQDVARERDLVPVRHGWVVLFQFTVRPRCREDHGQHTNGRLGCSVMR